MAIDRNRVTQADVILSTQGTPYCFPIPKSDTDYLTEPDDSSKPSVSGAISISAEEDVKVELWDGKVVTIPAGTLKAGVRYKLNVVKFFSTGSGGTVEVLAWRGSSVMNITSTTY